MERLWENGLPLWKVYGDPYRLPSHLLPGLVYIQAKKIPPTTIHARNNNTKVLISSYFNILYPIKKQQSRGEHTTHDQCKIRAFGFIRD